MESIKSKAKKDGSSGFVAERLSLRKEEQERLEAWVQELNAKFDGMIRLTKSDLANFLIRHHPETLSTEEIARIEVEHFDELRWMNWALGKIREAKKLGLALTLQELMDQRQKRNPTETKARKRASHKASGGNAAFEDKTNSLLNSPGE